MRARGVRTGEHEAIIIHLKKKCVSPVLRGERDQNMFVNVTSTVQEECEGIAKRVVLRGGGQRM